MGALAKLNFAPLAMNRETALAYTGLAPKMFDQMETEGSIRGKRLGRNGEMIYPRDQLDQIIVRLFGSSTVDVDDEFNIPDD